MLFFADIQHSETLGMKSKCIETFGMKERMQNNLSLEISRNAKTTEGDMPKYGNRLQHELSLAF